MQLTIIVENIYIFLLRPQAVEDNYIIFYLSRTRLSFTEEEHN